MKQRPFLSLLFRARLLILFPKSPKTTENLHRPTSTISILPFLPSVGSLLQCTQCPSSSPKTHRARNFICSRPVQRSLSFSMSICICVRVCNSHVYEAHGKPCVSTAILLPRASFVPAFSKSQCHFDTLFLCDRISDV